jgi:hypothetical protein
METAQTNKILNPREAYGESPGRALGLGLGAGFGGYVLLFLSGGLFDWHNPNGLTTLAAAMAASVTSFSMGAPLGWVLKLGVLAAICASLFFWFAGCTAGGLMLYGAGLNWADPAAALPKLAQIFLIVDLGLTIIIIGLAALTGLCFWEGNF